VAPRDREPFFFGISFPDWTSKSILKPTQRQYPDLPTTLILKPATSSETLSIISQVYVEFRAFRSELIEKANSEISAYSEDGATAISYNPWITSIYEHHQNVKEIPPSHSPIHPHSKSQHNGQYLSILHLSPPPPLSLSTKWRIV
jgi:hypothetical protein